MKKCKYCGVIHTDENLYCNKCGYILPEADESIPPEADEPIPSNPVERFSSPAPNNNLRRSRFVWGAMFYIAAVIFCSYSWSYVASLIYNLFLGYTIFFSSASVLCCAISLCCSIASYYIVAKHLVTRMKLWHYLIFINSVPVVESIIRLLSEWFRW